MRKEAFLCSSRFLGSGAGASYDLMSDPRQRRKRLSPASEGPTIPQFLVPVLFSLVFAAVIAAAPPRFRRWLLPPQRERAMPWTGGEILLILFLVVYVCPSLVMGLVDASGFWQLIYGPTFTLHTGHPLDQMRRKLWLATLAFPVQMGAILLVLKRCRGTQLYQLGLTRARLGTNVALGVLGSLIVTPPLTALLGLLERGREREDHPLTQLSKAVPAEWEWILIIGSAILVAPILEEVFFRGLLQRFFVARPWGGWCAWSVGMCMALLARGDRLPAALRGRDMGVITREFQPALFVLLLAPPLVVLSRPGRSPVASGIYGTAVLFAAMHSYPWPTPVPLFLFGLAIGWLAHRTQSLVGPITLHLLFNLVPVIGLLSQFHPRFQEENGKPETEPERTPPAVVIVTDIPGSWCSLCK